MTPADHEARLALLRTYASGRKASRAAADFYDAIVSRRPGADDPASLVAQAADAVFARVDAGAVTVERGAVQLAALTSAWRTLR